MPSPGVMHVSKCLMCIVCLGRYDTFMQHDVQELNRVLVDKLEEKMKASIPASV